MKNIMKIFSAIAVGAALALASCAESPFADAVREPSPEITSPVAFFTSAEVNRMAKIDIGMEDTDFDFHVIRPSKAPEALDVNLSLTGNGSDLFTAPAKVTIPANDSVGVITVKFDVAKLEAGKYYNLTLGITDNLTPYGISEINFSVGLLPWGKVGIAKYTPGFSNALFNIPEKTIYTKYQKVEGMEIYRLVNPYLPPYIDEDSGFPMGFASILPEEVLPGDHYIVIDATDPEAVRIDAQEIGISWPGYGAFIVAGSGVVLNGYELGTKKDDIIKVETVYRMPEYNATGWYALSVETIDFDGPFDPDGDDPELDWEPAGSGYYSSGFLTETTEEPVGGVLNVEYVPNRVKGVGNVRIVNAYPSLESRNSYTGTDYSIAFQVDLATLEPVEGSVEERAVGIFQSVKGTDNDGKPTTVDYPVYIENASITRDGLYTYSITADFYLFDLTNGEKYEDLGTFTDTFFWNVQPEKFALIWEAIGTGTFIDGLFPTFYVDPDGEQTPPYSAADWTWEVQVEQAEQIPSVYRIVNPYDAMGDAEMADVLYDEYYLVIDTTDDEGVFIDLQTAGVDVGRGEIGIGSAVLFNTNLPLGTIKDGVIDFGRLAYQDDTRAALIGFPMGLTLPGKEAPVATYAPYRSKQVVFDQKKVDHFRKIFSTVIARDARAL